MKNLILLIYPALWLGATFYHARIVKRGGVDPSFLDKDQTRMIQAFSCIGVVLHHLTQQITSYGIYNKGPITVLNYMGFLFTALFFFFSGFGLMTSLQTKPDYLKSFLYRRLPSVLIPFWTVNVLGVILNTAGYGAHRTAVQILSEIFGITLINSNGWFIVEIVILYLLFWLIFRLIPNRDVALALLCIATVLLIRYSFFQGHDVPGNKVHWFRGEWWFNSTIAFPVGLLTARFRKRLAGSSRAHLTLLLILFLVLAAVTFAISVRFVNRYGYYTDAASSHAIRNAAVTLASQMAACCAFIGFIVLLNSKVILDSPVMRYVGGISRELFLIHGYFVNRIFAQVRMKDFTRFAVVLALSFACTAVLSPCIRYLTARIVSGLSALAANLAKAKARRERIAREMGKIPRPHRAIRLKAFLPAMVLCILAACILIPVGKDLIARTQFREEWEAIRQAEAGSEVLWGRFKTDPSGLGRQRLGWIVIAKDKEKVCLVTREGIDAGCYYQKHQSVSWEESDLRKRLNSEAFLNAFSKYEKQKLLLVEDDYVTLLTVKQAMEAFPSQAERVLCVTPEAVRRGANADPVTHHSVWYGKGYCYSWWWLRGEKNQKSVTAPIVDLEGNVLTDRKVVNKPDGAIRPVLWIDVS